MSELIDKPKISIGIPVYNGEKLIEKTLNKIATINNEPNNIRIDKYKIVAEIAAQEAIQNNNSLNN